MKRRRAAGTLTRGKLPTTPPPAEERPPETPHEKSRRHKDPWFNVRTTRHQIEMALKKLAIIPAEERTERVVQAEAFLRQAEPWLRNADTILHRYYGFGK